MTRTINANSATTFAPWSVVTGVPFLDNYNWQDGGYLDPYIFCSVCCSLKMEMAYTESYMIISQLALIHCAWTSNCRYAFNGSRPNISLWLLTLSHRSPDPPVYPLTEFSPLTPAYLFHETQSFIQTHIFNVELAIFSTHVNTCLRASYCWNRCVLLIWMTDIHPHSILFLFAAIVNYLLWTMGFRPKNSFARRRM